MKLKTTNRPLVHRLTDALKDRHKMSVITKNVYIISKIAEKSYVELFLPVVMNCTGGRVYQECGPNCGQTCRKQEPEGCTEECVPGCNCPEVSTSGKK